MDEETSVIETKVPAEEKRSIAARFLERGLQNRFLSDGVIAALLVALTFLLPIFFIPSQSISVEFAKIILVSFVVILGTIAWAGMSLREGHASVPKSLVLFFGFLILVNFIASAIASPTPYLSFVGIAGEIGTVSSILTLFLLMYLSSFAFRTRDRVLYILTAVLASSVILGVYHLVRYVFGPIMGFGIFTTDVSTPAGKWNDLAALIGLITLLSILVSYFFSKNRSLRIPMALLFIAGLFFLVAIDFTILWMILFFVTAGFILFAIYEGEMAHRRARAEDPEAHVRKKNHVKRIIGHMPVAAIILLVVSFLYGSGLTTVKLNSQGRTIASYVTQVLHVPPYSEVVLTPGYTYQIIQGAIKQSPILGVGPNRFSSSYLELKTSDMNLTPFWDATFDFGSGRVPTFFTTTGLFGIALWLLFIIAMFLKLRSIYPLLSRDRIGAFLGVTLFLLTIYLWSIACFYLPNMSVFSLTFILTGTLIGFLVGEGVLGEYHAKFKGSGIAAFVYTPLTVLVFIGALSSGVLIAQETLSVIAFNDARIAIGNGNLDAGDAAIDRAISHSDRDIYERFKSSLAVVRLQQLAAKQGTDPKEVLNQADQLITVARTSAEKAIALDPTNFENELALGGVYDTLASMGIQGATDAARPHYHKALALNPKSPRVLFLIARLELVAGNRAQAKEYLYRALTERPNFLEAISALTQLELQDNNLDKAVAIIRNGVLLEPTNFLLRFALGYLYYANKDWGNATTEFESAVYLNPSYADAKYFLGLTYMHEGRNNDALQQFQGVQDLNPNNKDVASIIRNIKAGRQPFDAGIPTPTQPVSDALGGLKAQTSK